MHGVTDIITFSSTHFSGLGLVLNKVSLRASKTTWSDLGGFSIGLGISKCMMTIELWSVSCGVFSLFED